MQLSKRAKGRIWKAAGVILIILGVVALIAIIAAFSVVANGKRVDASGPMLVLFWFGIAGLACIRHGQKLAAITAEELLSRDKRAPVLYLRSFEEDPVTSKWTNFKSFFDYLWPFSKEMTLETEEITLGRVMKQIGPFIATGNPSEELPELGAARMYLSADDWEEKITRLIVQARLVVFRFGTFVTQGVCWEVQKVIELLKPQQLLFLIAFLPGEEYEYFREKVGKYFSQPLPDFPKRKIFNSYYEDRINAVIYFNQDWSAQILPLKGRKRKAELARELERVLTPVAKNIGQSWRKPITMRHRVLLIGISVTVLIVLINIWFSVLR